MELNKTKQKLGEQMLASADTDSLIKVLSAIKLIEEIEKTSTDKEKAQSDIDNVTYQKSTDLKKFYFGMSAPIITSIALIFTLIITISQNKTNAKFQLETQDYDRWKTLIEKINSPTVENDPSIPILLKSFYLSDKYKDNALVITTNYLLKVKDPDVFNVALEEYTKFVDKDNYRGLVGLTNAIVYKWADVDTKFVSEKQIITASGAVNSAYNKILLRQDSIYSERLENEISSVGIAIKNVIAHLNVNGAALDLSGVHFYNCNLDSVNFSRANLDGAKFDEVSVKDADLSNIDHVKEIFWNNSTWWQAKRISPKLLKASIASEPYNSSYKYYFEKPNDSARYNWWLKQPQAK